MPGLVSSPTRPAQTMRTHRRGTWCPTLTISVSCQPLCSAFQIQCKSWNHAGKRVLRNRFSLAQLTRDHSLEGKRALSELQGGLFHRPLDLCPSPAPHTPPRHTVSNICSVLTVLAGGNRVLSRDLKDSGGCGMVRLEGCPQVSHVSPLRVPPGKKPRSSRPKQRPVSRDSAPLTQHRQSQSPSR